MIDFNNLQAKLQKVNSSPYREIYQNGYVEVDIETIPYKAKPDPFSDPMSILTASTQGWSKLWKIVEGDELDREFLDILENPRIAVYMHNVSFDKWFLDIKYGINIQNVVCTLNSNRLLNLGQRVDNSLGAVALERLGVTMDKTTRQNLMMGRFGPKEYAYAQEDSVYLHAIHKDQLYEIQGTGALEALWIENRMVQILTNMAVAGIPFDVRLWDEYMQALTLVQRELAVMIYEHCGIHYEIERYDGNVVSPVNLSSPIQLLKVLADQKIYVKSTRAQELAKWRTNPDTPEKQVELLNLLYYYAKVSQPLKDNYPEFVGPDGRIRGHFNSLGANSSRMSSRNPNLQNIARPWKFLDTRLINVLLKNGFEKFVKVDTKTKRVLLRTKEDGTKEPSDKFTVDIFDSMPRVLRKKRFPNLSIEDVTTETQFVEIDFRQLFYAPEGWVWIGCDFSQVELRVFADLVGIKGMIHAFNEGDKIALRQIEISNIIRDSNNVEEIKAKFADELKMLDALDRSGDGCAHCATARSVFDDNKIGKGDDRRQQAKIVNFGCLCNGGGVRVLMNAALDIGVRMSYSEAKDIVDGIRSAYPEIDSWLEDIKDEIATFDSMDIASGYRAWMDLDAPTTKMRSFKVQGRAAVMMKKAIINVDDYIASNNLRDILVPVSTVHDELNLLCREEHAQRLAPEINRLMTEGGNEYLTHVKCMAEHYIHRTWKK